MGCGRIPGMGGGRDYVQYTIGNIHVDGWNVDGIHNTGNGHVHVVHTVHRLIMSVDTPWFQVGRLKHVCHSNGCKNNYAQHNRCDNNIAEFTVLGS